MNAYNWRNKRPTYSYTRRLHLLSAVVIGLSTIIAMRLFFLQVIMHGEYVTQAQSQHLEGVELQAKRGDIVAIDYHSGKTAPLATNSTWYLLYVDPFEVRDPQAVADFLTPYIFDYLCGEKIDQRMTKELCVNNASEFLGLVEKRMIPLEDEGKTTTNEDGEEVPVETTPKKQPLSLDISMEEVENQLRTFLLKEVSQTETTFSLIKNTTDKELLDAVDALGLVGVYTSDTMIWTNPTEVPTPETYAKMLSPLVSMDTDTLEFYMNRRPLRYVPILKKLDPLVADKIQEIKNEDYALFSSKQIEYPVYKGIVLVPQSYRYYPEGQVGSQMIGFVDHGGAGRYGVEEMFDKELRGTPGKIVAESDPFGRQITIRKSIIEPPEDGATLILTIDRVVQKELEGLLRKTVLDTKANGAQAVIMEPNSGDIIAMASYPTFDPNNFGDVYEMQKISFDPGRGIPVFVYDDELETVRESTLGERSDPYRQKYVYKNRFGPGTYQNLNVSGLFEPGSIFKPIIMASAIDAGEVTPKTRYFDAGEVQVDDFTIRNATDACMGNHDMIHALNYSCNIGMIFVAQRLGESLMYKYIEDFGFGDRTNIDVAGESKGKVIYYREWSDARFFNTSFGQGLTVTPLQMARAYSALANGGYLLQPQIVDKVQFHDGTEIESERVIVKHVISQDAANTITAMLTSAVEIGVARRGQVPGYSIAGKTGTSQTTFLGKYEKGVGNTITSMAGFAPANNPNFVIVLKIDRPRTSEWSEATSAPLFAEVAGFLLDYYNIPPDKVDF